MIKRKHSFDVTLINARMRRRITRKQFMFSACIEVHIQKFVMCLPLVTDVGQDVDFRYFQCHIYLNFN